MSSIIWVPGMAGIKTLNNPIYTPSTNEISIQEVAKENGWDFHKVSYQTAKYHNPTLSEMGAVFTEQFKEIQAQQMGQHIIIVASSLGCGVTLNGLYQVEKFTSPVEVIALKPVPDPIAAIEFEIKDKKTIAAIKGFAIQSLPINLNGDDGKGDTFTLTPDHLNDVNALKILSGMAGEFNASVAGSAIALKTIICGADDHLTPLSAMHAFKQAMGWRNPTIYAYQQADHTTDLSVQLKTHIQETINRYNFG